MMLFVIVTFISVFSPFRQPRVGLHASLGALLLDAGGGS
jgi:hypothetical protein